MKHLRKKIRLLLFLLPAVTSIFSCDNQDNDQSQCYTGTVLDEISCNSHNQQYYLNQANNIDINAPEAFTITHGSNEWWEFKCTRTTKACKRASLFKLLVITQLNDNYVLLNCV